MSEQLQHNEIDWNEVDQQRVEERMRQNAVLELQAEDEAAFHATQPTQSNRGTVRDPETNKIIKDVDSYFDNKRNAYFESTTEDRGIKHTIDGLEQAILNGGDNLEVVKHFEDALEEDIKDRDLSATDLARELAYAEFLDQDQAKAIITEHLDEKVLEQVVAQETGNETVKDHSARWDNIKNRLLAVKDRELKRLKEEAGVSDEAETVVSEKKIPYFVSYELIGDQFTWEEWMNLKNGGNEVRGILTIGDEKKPGKTTDIYLTNEYAVNLSNAAEGKPAPLMDFSNPANSEPITIGEKHGIGKDVQGVALKFDILSIPQDQEGEQQVPEEFIHAEAIVIAKLEEMGRQRKPEQQLDETYLPDLSEGAPMPEAVTDEEDSEDKPKRLKGLKKRLSFVRSKITKKAKSLNGEKARVNFKRTMAAMGAGMLATGSFVGYADYSALNKENIQPEEKDTAQTES